MIGLRPQSSSPKVYSRMEGWVDAFGVDESRRFARCKTDHGNVRLDSDVSYFTKNSRPDR